MKPQIVFVDDDPRVLAGIRRLMRKHSQLWDVHLVDTAEQALDLLDRICADVLVTDMRLPGTHGSGLLEEARRGHPATARVVLSGHADRQAIVTAAGPTQQFLSKPCQPEQLERVLAAVIGTLRLMDDENLRALIGAQESLPKPPSVYFRLTQLLADPEVTVKEVGHLIERDVATSAEVLKLVNSSFFGLATDVASVERAVSLLGLDVIQALVLAGSLFTAQPHLPAGLDAQAISRHGVAACLRARQIAQLEGWDPATAAHLALAALLHDLGLLVLATGNPPAWAQYAQRPADEPLWRAQTDAFGCTVGRASAYLLGLWGFAASVIAALANQPLDLNDPQAVASASPAEIVVAFSHQVDDHGDPPAAVTGDGYLDPARIARWTRL